MIPKAETDAKNGNMAPATLEGKCLGKYRILEPLGRGGMAQVYKAYHPQLDRYVAVKVLRSDLVEDAEFLNRFRREARAVAALRHPHIVQIYDFDAEDDLYYMVMELLEGDTLKANLNAMRARGERLPRGEVVRIFSDVLDGLSYAHGEGIIHRDLKPANIMLTKGGRAVLTDFGIAQIVGGTQYTISGALMGTLNYMSPEQGMEGRCDVRSDIYSLGIAFYEALTGKVPFDADTPLAILMKHINDPLPLPRKLDPSIPLPLEAVVLKALAKGADDRFQSAAEMSQALTEAARLSEVEVPATISPHQVNAADGSPFTPVAVFSGTERQNIPDADFASGDTDITYGRRLNQPPEPTAGVLRRAGALLTPPDEPGEILPRHVRRAVLSSVAGIVLANMIMLWVGGVFSWRIFAYTWPMELVVVGILLAALMTSQANYWFLIPTGIVLGNGLLFTFFSLTHLWGGWAYLWPLEPLLVGVSIVAPFLLKAQDRRGRWLARRIGSLLLFIAVLVFIFTMIVGTILST
jgi:serine/threonine protein kinase